MKCSACGSTRVYPSRLRNVYERARHALTGRQPYRCHNCNVRTWGDVHVPKSEGETHPDDLRMGRDKAPVKPADLDDLDSVKSQQ